MAERDRPPEGWGVRQRPAFLAAAIVPAALLAAVAGAGWLYARFIAPQTRQPVTTFPAPGVETFIHDGAGDPPRARPTPRPDPAVEAAKRALLARPDAWRR